MSKYRSYKIVRLIACEARTLAVIVASWDNNGSSISCDFYGTLFQFMGPYNSGFRDFIDSHSLSNTKSLLSSLIYIHSDINR